MVNKITIPAAQKSAEYWAKYLTVPPTQTNSIDKPPFNLIAKITDLFIPNPDHKRNQLLKTIKHEQIAAFQDSLKNIILHSSNNISVWAKYGSIPSIGIPSHGQLDRSENNGFALWVFEKPCADLIKAAQQAKFRKNHITSVDYIFPRNILMAIYQDSVYIKNLESKRITEL